LKRIIVQKDSYYDSVFLMLINRDVKEVEGVRDAVVSMGTQVNLELLSDMGLTNEEVDAATPNDLIIAVDAENEEAADSAVETARSLLKKKSSGAGGSAYQPTSLAAATEVMPDANLAVISVPGSFAAREARKALNAGLHVMLFSDNVPLEREVELKRLGQERGLLVMGPDCGTAIINGIPLCFANVVRRGNIGIIGASGTGLQEVTVQIDKLGGGVSQAVGTGGRDLKTEEVGGTTMLMALDGLIADADTEVIVVISKPPAESVAKKVISRLEKSGKPSVVHFIGLAGEKDRGDLHFASNLEETAGKSVALAQKGAFTPQGASDHDGQLNKIAARETERMAASQRYVRGLFTGGTLADEALIALHHRPGHIYSNNQTDKAFLLPDPHQSQGHTVVDLGDDVFTVGRPHPMIDPSIRNERIEAESQDPEVAVLLFDVVLGYAAHEDPAGMVVEAIEAAKQSAEARGGYLSAVCSVTGTARDPQGLEAQRRKLEQAGCVVMDSNYQAVEVTQRILEKVAQS
jgi:succinyl-CoA synthetase alpha subunit